VTQQYQRARRVRKRQVRCQRDSTQLQGRPRFDGVKPVGRAIARRRTGLDLGNALEDHDPGADQSCRAGPDPPQ
jgi:hypothetical protein